MEEAVNKDLVFTYFSGRATALEKESIDRWVKTPLGQELFLAYLQEWENSNLQYLANVEQGISRHFSRIGDHVNAGPQIESAPPKPEKHFGKRRWLLWVAASGWIGLLAAAGWLLRDPILYETHATGFGETRKLELAYGSRVTLNANSSLKVPRFEFGQKVREVFLKGEASFSVNHTKDHQRFIVHANNALEVDVLGTEFNVFARARETKVALIKGKVRLRYLDGTGPKNLTMEPGDLVTRDSGGQTSLAKTQYPKNFSAWESHRYILDNTPLLEVCHLFEDNFGITVVIADSALAMRTISGSFTALNAGELLEILTYDSGISYKKSSNGKTITLTE